jgi:hypothetical protein
MTAAAVVVVAFGLSWLLRDVPLRETAGEAGIESLGAPRAANAEAGSLQITMQTAPRATSRLSPASARSS